VGVDTDDPRHRFLPRVCVAVVAVVYLASAARYVLGGDNGEFVAIASLGGVPHPSGYPLMAAYLRAMHWLPGVSPAHSAALATSLLGVAASAALYGATRAWGASRVSSAVVTAGIALSSLMWKLATQAEVFALHALLAALIVMVAGSHHDTRGVWRVFLLALLAGAGLSNNHTIVTLAPIGLLGVVRGYREASNPGRATAAGFAGLALGLAPYLYIVAYARDPGSGLVWGDVGNLPGLLHHFLRRDFGSTSLGISDNGAPPLAHIWALASRMTAELHYAPALLAVLGAVGLARGDRPSLRVSQTGPVPIVRAATLHESTVTTRPPRRPFTRLPSWRGVDRTDGLLYVGSLLLAGPVLVARFNLPLEGLASTICERFYLLPLLLTALPLTRGIDVLFDRMLQTLETSAPLVVATATLSIIVGYNDVREHHRPDVELYLANTLAAAPPDAVLLGSGDHRLYGFWYLQRVLGVAPGVVYVDPQMLHYPWYRRQVETSLGLGLEGIAPGNIDTARLAAGLLAAGRPVYLTNRFSQGISRQFATYPIGTLIHVLPPGARPPPPTELERMNLAVSARFLHAASAPSDPNGWAYHVQGDYIRPWRALADAYTSLGREDDARRCRERGLVLPDIDPPPLTRR